MLDARGRGAAERECQCGHHRAANVPAAVAEIEDQADATEEQRREHDRIGGPEARGAIEHGEQEMQRRKDQRLRVGDLRPAGEYVRRPERRLAVVQRAREKAQLRMELRLGVPRNGDRARKPRPGEHHEARRVERDRGAERESLSRIGIADSVAFGSQVGADSRSRGS